MARRRGRGGRFARRSSGGGGGGGGGGGRRSTEQRSGPSPKKIRDNARIKTLAIGSLTSLAFGLLQSKVQLPGFDGVPNSLTYGGAGLAVGLLAGSDTMTSVAMGPWLAGLHNVGLHGFSGTSIAGDDSSPNAVFPEIAGDFEDLRV